MYEPEPIDPDGGSLTIRPVYEYEAAEYIDHLIRGDACVHRQGQDDLAQEPLKAQPPMQFVAPSDEQPTSLREELEAMGWFTDM
jgi:hypothetical protein